MAGCEIAESCFQLMFTTQHDKKVIYNIKKQFNITKFTSYPFLRILITYNAALYHLFLSKRKINGILFLRFAVLKSVKISFEPCSTGYYGAFFL
ncbi:hypothetical protein T06_13864 [Trichinella sp. T6]|nr:hypothetical protein T06_13864 [Trichinella sp. T6]